DPVRFPNTRRRASGTVPPDTMPPAADPDTCRICRGEGSPDEPLFFPCRCSGSIKYVHQDCLMEWLSHSQKKHCELCKTPFRFTKLYDPDMPKTLPAHVFVRHTARYLLRNLVVWLRAALVASVWLGWLPYLMRAVWSFLFWIADEGLGGRPALLALHGAAETLDALAPPAGTGACPSSPLFAASTTVAGIGGVLDSLPPESARIVRSLYGINLTSNDPIYAAVLQLLFGSVGLAEKPISTAAAIAANATAVLAHLPSSNATARQSLLSDVGFLRNLTRHDSVNRVVIATLEGQIITVLVIVCFILIILVRDYVVQQQPEINMRAAFAAIDNPPPAAPAQDGPGQDAGAAEAGVAEEAAGGLDHDPEDDNAAAEPSARPRPTTDPDIADPDLAATAPTHDLDRATVHEYLAIYREADGDPERILKIARERRLEVKLDYWVRLTLSMTDLRRDGELPNGSEAGPSSAAAEPNTASGGWADVSTDAGHGEGTSKGKSIAEVGEPAAHPAPSPPRPRANTDGPRPSNGINPLANNSWSFTDLPPEPFPPPAPHPETDPEYPGPDPAAFAWDSEAESETSSLPHPPSPTMPPGDSPHGPERNEPDGAGAQPPAEAPPRREPAGLVDRVADFMWAEADRIPPDELAPINWVGDFGEDAADDAGPEDAGADQADRDRDRDAAEAPGLDAEAVEDAEDLEGILELLGMRGPLVGLLQNAIFCAFLVSITIFLGVFVPYNLGRLAIWAVANPLRLAQMLFGAFRLAQDCCALVLGFATSMLSEAVHALCRAFLPAAVADRTRVVARASWEMVGRAAARIAGSVLTDLPSISSSEVRTFSVLSHEALLTIKGRIALAASTLWDVAAFALAGDYSAERPEAFARIANASAAAWAGLKALPAAALTPSTWVVSPSPPEPMAAAAAAGGQALGSWGATDRIWAVVAGYTAVTALAALYLRRGAPLATGRAAQEWEASLVDGLHQASGVMKVMLIISIEMLIFPLYCGVLLDVALLPLFEGATVSSRLRFAACYPVTAIFVHWFVGTGYMFHFALFVSMCRKIMRRGVLYFIRDPDDPEFHPVRDVLERNVTTQLRKILFSALVYGALVMVCLGGVVWGLALALPRVLPIRYSSNEPVLEFPLDLLFYNFLMPLAVRFFRPADGLHAMYTWWFRRCARALRLTWFLFGERRIDEEGRLVLAPDAPDRALPPWRRWFLEVDARGRVVARGWRAVFEGGTRAPTGRVIKDSTLLARVRKADLVESGQLVPDGRFVRTPASDQVKIPKGANVFLPVTEDNARADGLPDHDAADIYSTAQYQLVYVPPHFRVRVFLFILFIWVFAAVSGVAITIVPLVFGRWLFRRLLPAHIRTNDVYAFSIGIHVLGAAAYALFRAPAIYQAARARAAAAVAAVAAATFPTQAVLRAARVVYTYFFTLVVFPLLLASLMELYTLVPLHELMYSALLRPEAARSLASSGSGDAGPAGTLNPVHTVRVVQAWMVGLLYLRLGLRVTNTWFEGSHVSNAARAVLRRGWLDPDASILTRAFIVPGLAVWLAAVAVPLLLARSLAAYGVVDGLVAQLGGPLAGAVPERALRDACLVLLYRLSFPLTAALVGAGIALWAFVGVVQRWKARIRDEAYLIGERLHNYAGTTGGPRPRGAWRG
ncbi:uncharacterized protein THITE_2028472, partial [Thermothielavioides terrestris NRRL 8126]